MKQIVFVFFNDGEKLSFQNENAVVKDKDGKIKLQCSCYRLFLIFAVGNFSITNVLVQKSNHYGFRIAMMTSSFRLYGMIGSIREGNSFLHRKQYNQDLSLASYIVNTKIMSQKAVLDTTRNKSDYLKEVSEKLEEYLSVVSELNDPASLRAYEGLASKQYFRAHFNNVEWKGRQPRLKLDYINSSLDIGYTILFAYIEALLAAFGFDLYVGLYHTEFYMRKSLVCDIVEPFRTIIDSSLKKAINLNQIKADDFRQLNHRYVLKYEKNKHYASLFVEPLIKYREEIYQFILLFYRAIMKGSPVEEFPSFFGGKTYNGADKLRYKQ